MVLERALHLHGQFPRRRKYQRLNDLFISCNNGILQDLQQLLVLGVALSLLCVGLLGAFLLVITGQTRRTQALVEQRTLELAALAHTMRTR